eukprot:403343948
MQKLAQDDLKQNKNEDFQMKQSQSNNQKYGLNLIDSSSKISLSQNINQQQQQQQPITRIKQAPYQKILKEIELEAEKILPNKKLLTFFEDMYEPLKVSEDDINNLRAILRAIADISANEGQTMQLEEQLNKNIILKRENDYTTEQLRKAKEIFDDCQKHDMEMFGISRINNQNLTQNFQKINRDQVIGKLATENPTIDQIPAKIMGQHKALLEGDLEKYQELRDNKFSQEEILNYLDDYRKSDLSYFDKQLSDDLNVEFKGLNQQDDFEEYQFDFDMDFTQETPGMLINLDNKPSVLEQKPHSKPRHIESEKIKLKMFDELENIDHIIKSAENNVKMTRHEYLHHLRLVYHEKVTGLKQQRDLFRSQLNKMQKAHTLQMRNIENFALSIAADMFRKKAEQVRDIFKVESDQLNKEYYKLHNLMGFYEKRFESLKTFLATQESLLQNQYLFMTENMRKKKKYLRQKEQALLEKKELDNERFSKIPVKEFMRQEFDFYGFNIKISQYDQSKLVKNMIFKRFERENEQTKVQLKFAKNEVETMQRLMELAQNQESKARIELFQVQQELEQEKILHFKNIALKEKENQINMQRMKNYCQKIIDDYKSYRQLVNQESQVNSFIIAKVQFINNQLQSTKSERNMLQHILKYPHICKEFHLRVKSQVAFDTAKQMLLINQVYKEFFNGPGGMPIIPENKASSSQARRRDEYQQTQKAKQGGRSSPTIQEVSIFNRQNLLSSDRQIDVMSEDVKNYLGDIIYSQKQNQGSYNVNSNQSQTTRLYSSQYQDLAQGSAVQNSIEWALSSSVIQNPNESQQMDLTARPLLTQSTVDTPINLFRRNTLLNKANQILSLPTTRAQMRPGARYNFNHSIQDPLQTMYDYNKFGVRELQQKPLLIVQQIENKRLAKRNYLNQSLQNPNLKWNELSTDDRFNENSLDQTLIPINGNKRYLELHFEKKHKKRELNKSISPEPIQEQHAQRLNTFRDLQSKYKANYQSLNDRQTRNIPINQTQNQVLQQDSIQMNSQEPKPTQRQQTKNPYSIDRIRERHMQIRKNLKQQQNMSVNSKFEPGLQQTSQRFVAQNSTTKNSLSRKLDFQSDNVNLFDNKTLRQITPHTLNNRQRVIDQQNLSTTTTKKLEKDSSPKHLNNTNSRGQSREKDINQIQETQKSVIFDRDDILNIISGNNKFNIPPKSNQIKQ